MSHRPRSGGQSRGTSFPKQAVVPPSVAGTPGVPAPVAAPMPSKIPSSETMTASETETAQDIPAGNVAPGTEIVTQAGAATEAVTDKAGEAGAEAAGDTAAALAAAADTAADAVPAMEAAAKETEATMEPRAVSATDSVGETAIEVESAMETFTEAAMDAATEANEAPPIRSIAEFNAEPGPPAADGVQQGSAASIAVAPEPMPPVSSETVKPVPESETSQIKPVQGLKFMMMKTTEDFVAFGQANLDAFMKSGQIWSAGMQELSKQFATTAKASFEESVSTFKALTTVRSVKEAIELQSTFAKTSLEKAMAESNKLTDASIKLTEQALAPITARVTVAVETFGKAV